MSEVELEVVRAEVTCQEFEKDTAKQSFSYLVLALLMSVQLSNLWTKFIIGAAYNYKGVHTGEAKWDIQVAIPNFTYVKYT